MGELRSFSDGRPADQEASYRSGASRAADQPGMIGEGETSRRHQGGVDIESEHLAAPVETRYIIGACKYRSGASRAEGQSGAMEEGETSQILRGGLDIETEYSEAPESLI